MQQILRWFRYKEVCSRLRSLLMCQGSLLTLDIQANNTFSTMLFCVCPILRLCIRWLLQSHWNAECFCVLSLEGRVVTSIICHAGYFSSRYTVSLWWTPHWYSGWQEQPLKVSSPSPAEEIHFAIHVLICVVWLQQLLWLFWWMKKVLWWSTFDWTYLHPKRGDLCVFLLFNFIWEGVQNPLQISHGHMNLVLPL